MSGLAVGLLAIAAVFADRAVATSRRERNLRRLGAEPRDRAAPAIPPWAPTATAAAAGWILAEPIGSGLAVVVVLVARSIRRARRRARAQTASHEQLVDATRTIAAALRAGLSIPQALAYAQREAEPPLSTSLSRLVAALSSGSRFDDAVEAWASAAGGDDPRLVASVLRLHRRTGGDLPTVLDRLADALRDRLAARREVRALTAQARLSGAILGVLPIGFFAFLWITSRSEIETALASPVGITSIGTGLVLEVAAFVWIRRLLEVRT